MAWMSLGDQPQELGPVSVMHHAGVCFEEFFFVLCVSNCAVLTHFWLYDDVNLPAVAMGQWEKVVAEHLLPVGLGLFCFSCCFCCISSTLFTKLVMIRLRERCSKKSGAIRSRYLARSSKPLSLVKCYINGISKKEKEKISSSVRSKLSRPKWNRSNPYQVKILRDKQVGILLQPA